MNNNNVLEPDAKTAVEGEAFRLKTIMVPMDFSEPAKVALRFAVHLAGLADAKIIVLHVVESPNSYHGFDQEVIEALTKEAQHSLDEVCRTEAAGLENLETMVRLPLEPVAKEIVMAARETAADAIVVPANHRNGFTLALFSHTADKIGHEAPCPVLLVPMTHGTTERN